MMLELIDLRFFWLLAPNRSNVSNTWPFPPILARVSPTPTLFLRRTILFYHQLIPYMAYLTVVFRHRAAILPKTPIWKKFSKNQKTYIKERAFLGTWIDETLLINYLVLRI
jgi:hypothetical protein